MSEYRTPQAFRAAFEARQRKSDLIDIALVASEPALQPRSMAIAATMLRDALEATFAFRGTHPVPAACPPPPASWAARYPRDRELNGLPWPRIEDVHAEVARFLDPVLAKATSGVWVPASRTWM